MLVRLNQVDMASESTSETQTLEASTDWFCAGYLASLRESRTFNCPDCVDAMAEAFGITAAVNQLRVRSSPKHDWTPNSSNTSV